MTDTSAPTQRNLAKLRRVAKKRSTYVWIALLLLFWLFGIPGYFAVTEDDPVTLRLLTGTENRDLDPIIKRFADQEGVKIETSYQGSVDTMLDLQQGAEGFDAVWPASSIWMALGDSGGIVSQTQSISRTPVVFGVKRSVAERLGWVGRDVTVEDILQAAESGQLRYMMTSATQSNSGAMAYLGYLYAFAGQPDILTSEMLHDPVVVERTKRILGAVNRSAGASGFLRDLFLSEYDAYDGMVNNESAIINANRQLTTEGRELLYVIYPVDGLAIADWPLGFIDRGDKAKADLFTKFQQYLLSDEVKQELLKAGRRAGMAINPTDADPTIFNPDWGIDLTRTIVPIKPPSAEVILEALTLYQTVLRKPSFTVFCLDFSGSMEGKGEDQLKEGMGVLLDPDQSSRYLLQTGANDITIVLPFNDALMARWKIEGNDPAGLRELLTWVSETETDGGTNIYDPVIAALDEMESVNLETYSPAVILLTDGQSNAGSWRDLEARMAEASPVKVPVYAILFGDASRDQLDQIADATSGKVFDGRSNLINVLRQVKGYN